MLVSVIIGIIGLVVMMIIMTPLAVDLIDEDLKNKWADDIASMISEVWENFEEAGLYLSVIITVIGAILTFMKIEIGPWLFLLIGPGLMIAVPTVYDFIDEHGFIKK